MKTARVLLLLASLAPVSIIGAALPIFAQDAPSPETLQAAQDLVAIINKDALGQMAGQLTQQVWPTLERGLQAKNPTLTPPVMGELRGEFVRIQTEFLSKVMDDAPVIYARHFTAAELRELLGFYRSPVGQKALHELPQIVAESMAMVMPRVQQVQVQVMDAFTKILRQRGLAI